MLLNIYLFGVKNVLIIFSLSCFLVETGNAQLTIGQVFDFEIGDEFHYKSNYDGPFWVERKTVIDKWYLKDSAIVNYKWKIVVSGIDPNTLENFVRTKEEITSYSNLDSSILSSDLREFLNGKDLGEVTFIDDSKYLDSSLNTWYVIDTTFSFDSMVCEHKTEGMVIREGPFPHLIDFEYHVYGKGLGEIYFVSEYYDGISEEYYYQDVLFYFKKANDSCGTPDYTSVQNPLAINELEVFPNPATAAIHININEIVEYSLTDINGKTVCKGAAQGRIDILGLTEGVYVLRVKVDNKIHIKKITKLNSQF
jgi:hypothetical protein